LLRSEYYGSDYAYKCKEFSWDVKPTPQELMILGVANYRFQAFEKRTLLLS
jgi:hypothetical protein